MIIVLVLSQNSVPRQYSYMYSLYSRPPLPFANRSSHSCFHPPHLLNHHGVIRLLHYIFIWFLLLFFCSSSTPNFLSHDVPYVPQSLFSLIHPDARPKLLLTFVSSPRSSHTTTNRVIYTYAYIMLCTLSFHTYLLKPFTHTITVYT